MRDPRTGALERVPGAPAPAELPGLVRTLRLNQLHWSAAGVEHRILVLQRFAAVLGAKRVTVHAALSRDTGRWRIADLEIDSVLRAIDAWCGLAPTLARSEWTQGRALPHVRHRARFVPYPLVTVVSPWNFPLLLAMIDTLPALLAVLPGDRRTAAAMIELGGCVCFTGSVATGGQVAMQAARRLIPAFLELGGKDPLIVLEGANLDAATDAALRGSVLASGQACQSIERIYVARTIHDEFVGLLSAKARAVRFNHPMTRTGDIGPIIFEAQARTLAARIADARARGARVRTGGEIENHGGGLWLAPTVLTGVTHAMQVMTEERFGPVMPVMAFDSIDAAVDLANDSQFGLSAAVFGPDSVLCEAIAARLEAGAVSINVNS